MRMALTHKVHGGGDEIRGVEEGWATRGGDPRRAITRGQGERDGERRTLAFHPANTTSSGHAR